MSEQGKNQQSSRMVLQPHIMFDDVAQLLQALAWTRQPAARELAPLVQGEPEVASWTHAESQSALSYTFNPVVKLRVLSFSGEQVQAAQQQIAQRLPTLGLDDLQQLLIADDSRELLLGIFAAAELKAVPLLAPIARLASHPDVMVANAATRAQQTLAEYAVGLGVEKLQAEARRQPEYSALFPHSGNAHDRRQVLRWLLSDATQVNDDMIKVLRTALADVDWEVRVTSMLVAGRLQVSVLGPEIKRMALPTVSRDGPAKMDREILLALRKAVLAHLSHESLVAKTVDHEKQRPVGKEAMWQHLLQCVAGNGVPYPDRIFTLVQALTTPLDLQGPPPQNSASIIKQKDAYRLARSGIVLRWVAPIPHWLGADEDDLVAHPLRLFCPPQGFYISTRLLMQQQVQGGEGDADEPYLATCDQALALCEQLSFREGVRLSLPSAAQWEMAARGPDARRHPWGNGLEGDPASLISPWGMAQIFTRPQWVTSEGGCLIAGGDKGLRCAARQVFDDTQHESAVRIIIGHL